MKNLHYFFLGLFVFSCTGAPKTAMVSGTIVNPVDTLVRLNGGILDTVLTASLNSDHSFTIEFPLDTTGELFFWHGQEYTRLFLEPGYDLNLTLNTDSFDETLVFDGIGASPNNYLVAKGLLEEKGLGYRDLYRLTWDDFKAEIQGMQENQQKLIDQYRNNKTTEFWDKQEISILYNKLISCQRYPDNYKYYNDTDDVYLGEDYENYLEEADFNRPEYLDVREYISFLINHIYSTVRKKMSESEDGDHDWTLISLQTAVEVYAQQEIVNRITYSLMLSPLQYYTLDDTKEAVDYFLDHCTNETYKSEIKEIVTKKEALAKGQPAPGFTGTDLEGNSISLSDFLGKYVFVDVWATWCGPCIQEIPYLKQIETDLHGRNIIFISYSLDNNKEDWEKMVIEKELQGVQIIGESGGGSKISQDYMISGIPTFILIDRNGKIISSQAERPSGKIKDTILALEGI